MELGNARTRTILVFALCAAAAASAAGCRGTVASVGPRSVRSPDPGRILGSYAPAGQRVAVRLDHPIDTLRNTAGAEFTARLEDPIVGSQGQVFARAGATVRGRVESLGTDNVPRVRLRFDSVDTVYGSMPVAAAIRDASYQTYRGPIRYQWSPRPGGFGATGGYGYSSLGISPFGDTGGWYYDDFVPSRSREVRIPQGARLELQLTRPILAPGTVVTR